MTNQVLTAEELSKLNLEISLLIYNIYKDKNFTLDDLREKSAISKKQIKKILYGNNCANMAAFCIICKILGVSMDELLENINAL